MNRRGSILILLLPTLVFLFLVGVFLKDFGRALYYSQRAQITADTTLLSCLRIRVDGMESVAARWEAVGQFIAWGDAQGAVVPAALWPALENETVTLKKAVPGYKGRITSVLKVAAEANGYKKESVALAGTAVSDLGLSSQGQWITDETGHRRWIPDLWYQRTWGLGGKMDPPSAVYSFRGTLSDPVFGSLSRTSQAVIKWDVSPENPAIQTSGNGGFSRNWSEALDGGQVRPARYPFFQAVLIGGGE